MSELEKRISDRFLEYQSLRNAGAYRSAITRLGEIHQCLIKLNESERAKWTQLIEQEPISDELIHALPAGADRDLVTNSLASYGAEGVANGVSVSTGRLADGVAAEARTAYFDFQNGTFTAQVEVVLSDRGGGNLAVDVAHEGRHVADAQEFAAALTADVAANGAESTLAIMGAANRTRYEREVRGYTVSSLVARGLGLDNLNITPSNGRNYEIWNRGWRNVDRERLRGINNLLRDSPSYGLTPENPGQRYIPRP